MISGKAKTLAIEEWETERVRLEADLAQARAVGVGVRAALRLVLLHSRVKPEETQEQEQEQKEEAPSESSKKRKTEEQDEQGKEEEKKQWYAGYFELKKALADYIATKPADYVHPDHMSNPLQKIRRIDNAPAVQYVTRPGVWGERFHRLGSFRASMRKGLHHEECALNDIHKMVRDGYTVRPERANFF